MKPIEEMTGLELREAVAVEVMGELVRLVNGRWMCRSCDGSMEWVLGVPPPAYESSIEAAFAVVEKMHPEYGFILERGPGDWSVWYVVCKRNGRAFYGPEFVDGSLPSAICRASLKAVRAK